MNDECESEAVVSTRATMVTGLLGHVCEWSTSVRQRKVQKKKKET
jgi:hypothetical protein